MKLKKVHFFYFFIMMIFCWSQFQAAMSKDHHISTFKVESLSTTASHFCADAKISNEDQRRDEQELPNKNIPISCHHHCSDHLVYLYDLNLNFTLFLDGNIQFSFKRRNHEKIYIELTKPPSNSYLS